jgi:hypothetical protein
MSGDIKFYKIFEVDSADDLIDVLDGTSETAIDNILRFTSAN